MEETVEGLVEEVVLLEHGNIMEETVDKEVFPLPRIATFL